MLQTCKTCGTRYDDVYRYTTCPHEIIGATKAQGYCRECDLFYCMRHFGNPANKSPAFDIPADPSTFPMVNPEDPPIVPSTYFPPLEKPD
jgi:hypothetical protein